MIPPSTVSPLPPAARAQANFLANTAALRLTQPGLLGKLPPLPGDMELVLGRDGSLTARRGAPGAGGGWMGNCSVPAAAADQLLKTLDLRDPVACLIAPDQAAQLRVALDRATPRQAILPLIPHLPTLTLMLHCADFSPDLHAHRLWFAAGEHWPTMLAEVLRQHPGLPMPGQFIRTIVPEATLVEAMIQQAQAVFSAETAHRHTAIESAKANWQENRRQGGESTAAPGRLLRGCAVVPGGFRLWEGAAGVLAGVAESAFAPLRRYDPHIPTSASPLGLALAAGEAEVLLMADKARSDLPGLLPAGIRCVTWCTTGVIAAAPGEAVQDRLLLADAAWFAGALRAGWRQEQIAVASWPIVRSESPAGTGLAIIADTVAVEGEPQMELSSHRLLWQAIAADLRKDPLVLGGDAVRYIHEQRERMNIDAAGFDLTRFLGALVIPAYQQSLARVLLEAGVAVRLHGAGWEDIAEFRPHAAGPVRSRDALYAAAAGARALVHVWPERGAHEIDSLGRPVVRPPGRRRESFVREAKAALAGEAGRAREIQGQATLSGALLREVLG